ncbi:non-specific serine/threonine protein kinase [Ranunculus cassubicifolius]
MAANFFLLLYLIFILNLQKISSLDFILNEFNSSTISVYGDTRLESNILTLTNSSIRAMGRAFFPTALPTKSPNSIIPLPFYTSFIFSISSKKGSLSGHGLVFFFSPVSTIRGGSSAQHLGLFNRTNDGEFNNHVLGVEFDLFENQEFNDIDNNHVGLDVNSLTSIASHSAGYWDDDKFKKLKLNNGVNYQVWVDYLDSFVNVTMAPAGMKRPRTPLLSVNVNLSDVFLDEMYVGFTAATGNLVQTHRILSWCFSNSNANIGDELVTLNLPSFVPPGSSSLRSKGFIVGISVSLVVMISCGIVICLVLKRKRKLKRDIEEMEDWEVEYWPHRITYKDIHTATKDFSDENLIGAGGNGKVYKGVLAGGVEVAVKCVSHEREKGVKEFLAEVSSLGRLRHRKLVGFRGWCKRQKSLILVFDYMENGSLDKRIFECGESLLLCWEDRVRVLKDVAEGVLYLHEGWEARVLHRDIKASNILLDKDMNGRLGDFGLARMHDHGQDVSFTRVVGTAGYMAPEIVQRGRASAQTDVFAFGVLVLEVICGRRPVEDGKPALVDWIWGLMDKGELIYALDSRLTAKGGFDMDEGEKMLHLGLLCAHPDPRTRPTMRQALKVLDGTACEGESEGEGMEVSLLEKMKSSAMWSKCHHDKRHGGHQTFDQIRHSLSISASLSGSDVIVVGR